MRNFAILKSAVYKPAPLPPSLLCSDIRHVTSCCCGLVWLSVKAEKRGKLGKENEENNIIKILLQVSFMSSIFVWYQCQVLENVFFILRTPLFSLPSFNFYSMLCSLLPSNSNRPIVTPKLQFQKMNVTQFKIASKCVTHTYTHTHTHTHTTHTHIYTHTHTHTTHIHTRAHTHTHTHTQSDKEYQNCSCLQACAWLVTFRQPTRQLRSMWWYI